MKTPRAIARYALTALVVVMTTAAAWMARPVLALPDLVALYLLAIMWVAVRYGSGPSVLSSALSVVAYDLFFIEPYYTFAVRDLRHALTFVLMFAVGLLISQLTQRARSEGMRARTEEIRSSILSTVSHDLRTPLAVISGASSALRDDEGALDGEARRELLDTVCQEATRLERLVVNLLDMTRIESGGLEMKRQWVPLDELVGAALARVESRAADRRIATSLPADLPLAWVDPILVEHALVNLLDNAMKHTPAPGEITLFALVHDGVMDLGVSDRGPGLPADVAPLFEKFVRRASDGVQGMGLGLAIARGIVLAHGGEIRAENRAEGGAVFTLSFPAGPQAPPCP